MTLTETGFRAIPDERTRTAHTMAWSTYGFEDAPELTREEVRAQREIARLLPDAGARQQLRQALGLCLSRFRKEGSDGLTVASVDDFAYVRSHGSAASESWSAGNHPVHVRIDLGRKDLFAIVDVPLASARSIIGQVVDVSPDRLGASDLLSNVEQGILAFFAERIATGVTERVPFFAPLLPVTIRDITCSNAEIDWGRDGASGWYSVAVVVQVAGLSLPFRLLLPWAALERVRRDGEMSDLDESRRRRRLDQIGRTLGNCPVNLTAALGRAEIRRGDLDQLEPTDILLFEARDFGWEDGRFSNHLSLVHTEDGVARIETEVIEDDGVLQLRVQSLLAGSSAWTEEELEVRDDRESKDGSALPGGDAESTQPHGVEAVGGGSPAGRAAAEDTKVQLRIELGRMRLTIRELAQLSPGAILEMRRDPTAPVSLVVDDRVIGTGDLVRIEGELGVRIASLV